jgi:signal transduction histidine kinase
MSPYRYFSTTISRQSHIPVLSEVVKQLSKFSSHDELLEYSQRPISYCYGNRMIYACSPHHSTPINLIQTASDLHDQLLVRVAHCICHFQSLPFLPAANPTLLSLHERYLKLFENLAHFPEIKTEKDEEKFFNLINIFMFKNNDIIGQLSIGCRDAQKYFKSYQIMKEFLDHVLQTRLSMRLIAEHYLELHNQQKKTPINDHWRGAICMNFSPAKAVQQSIDDVSAICFDTYSVVPHVQIEDYMQQSLPYFPHVVEYILRELLKNSMRAIVEYNQGMLGNMHNVKKYLQENRQEPLCKVLITSDPDDEHFTIAIQDQGGGIDATNEKIFQYMFTGK